MINNKKIKNAITAKEKTLIIADIFKIIIKFQVQLPFPQDKRGCDKEWLGNNSQNVPLGRKRRELQMLFQKRRRSCKKVQILVWNVKKVGLQ